MADLMCVGALLVNDQGKLLLQQRDDRPDLLFPGCWKMFGGAIEDGETPDEAMRRELLEEIELELPLNLWKAFDEIVNVKGTPRLVRHYIYIGLIDQPAESITLNEGQALGYFGPEDLEKLEIGYGFETLFREFFAARWNGVIRDVKVQCVSAILLDAENRVLLQQRDEKPDLPFGGYWALFGGRVEKDEEPEAAMRRELQEELELDVRPLKFWKTYERFEPGKGLTVVQSIYVGQVNLSKGDLVIHEGQDAGFFRSSQLADLKIAFGFDALLEEFYGSAS